MFYILFNTILQRIQDSQSVFQLFYSEENLSFCLISSINQQPILLRNCQDIVPCSVFRVPCLKGLKGLKSFVFASMEVFCKCKSGFAEKKRDSSKINIKVPTCQYSQVQLL